MQKNNYSIKTGKFAQLFVISNYNNKKIQVMIRNPEKCIGDTVPSWHLDHDVIEEYTDLVNELYDKHGIGCVYEIADRLKEDAKRYGGRMSRKDAEQTAWQILCRVKLGKAKN